MLNSSVKTNIDLEVISGISTPLIISVIASFEALAICFICVVATRLLLVSPSISVMHWRLVWLEVQVVTNWLAFHSQKTR